MTITLHTALDMFRDNIEEIEHAVKSNLQDDLDTEKEDAKQLGTGWIADEVRKLRVEQRHGSTKRRLRQIVYYRQSLTIPRPGQITPTDIDRARSYPIQDLYPGKLRKQGGKYWACCCFHTEDTPSLVIDTKRNNWRCFGACGVGGDAIDFYMRLNRVGFIQAVKKLSV